MLKEVDFQHAIKALYADRACDRHKFYKLCNEYDIKTKIPPINNAAEHPEIDYMSDRNAAIRLIKLLVAKKKTVVITISVFSY